MWIVLIGFFRQVGIGLRSNQPDRWIVRPGFVLMLVLLDPPLAAISLFRHGRPSSIRSVSPTEAIHFTTTYPRHHCMSYL